MAIGEADALIGPLRRPIAFRHVEANPLYTVPSLAMTKAGDEPSGEFPASVVGSGRDVAEPHRAETLGQHVGPGKWPIPITDLAHACWYHIFPRPVGIPLILLSRKTMESF